MPGKTGAELMAVCSLGRLIDVHLNSYSRSPVQHALVAVLRNTSFLNARPWAEFFVPSFLVATQGLQNALHPCAMTPPQSTQPRPRSELAPVSFKLPSHRPSLHCKKPCLHTLVPLGSFTAMSTMNMPSSVGCSKAASAQAGSSCTALSTEPWHSEGRM